VDPHELAVRAVVGQQVSVAGARKLLGRLTAEHGRTLDQRWNGSVGSAERDAEVRGFFPDAATLAALDPDSLPLPRARARSVVGLASALAEGSLILDAGVDAEETRARLVRYPGIGPWTADYIALRALGHPDIMLPSDLGVRRALTLLGHRPDPAAVERRARRWRPWRSYALVYLWSVPERGRAQMPNHHSAGAHHRRDGRDMGPSRRGHRHARPQPHTSLQTATRKAAP
jgi:AraC family transcriptional regulator, regulatory protein of adaptative response / DNA-3-methyladenine glycosylase II